MAFKIAIVSEYYYPLLGGITENVHHTALALAARGHDVTIVTSRVKNGHVNGNDPCHEATRVVRIGHSFRIPSNGSIARGTIGLHLWREMRGFFMAEKFDIVHAHSPLVFTLPPISVIAAPCPSIGTFHTYFEGSRVYEHFHGILQKQFLDRLDAVTAVSQSCVDSLSRYFTLRDPRIIPNGIDVNLFHPDAERLEKFDRSKLTLLFLGRFEKRNGFPLMLEAFKRVREVRDDVRLVVVGDGALRSHYEGLVPDALRPDVHFEGFVLSKRPAYYATCDIFCSPISKASFGITLLEAMASGKPIVATDNVGYRHLLDREEAVLTPAGDAGAFADALLDLLDDPGRREAMGLAGRDKSFTFSWDRVADQTLDLYSEVLARE
jgi:phosphatidyl-myo-inositol alpha-mannosyltransferase